MSITIRAVGQASKRGKIPRLPSGEKLLAEVDEWLASAPDETLRGRPADGLPDGATTSDYQFHPAARNVQLEAVRHE